MRSSAHDKAIVNQFFKKYNDFHDPEKCKKSFLDPLHEIFLFLITRSFYF